MEESSVTLQVADESINEEVVDWEYEPPLNDIDLLLLAARVDGL